MLGQRLLCVSGPRFLALPDVTPAFRGDTHNCFQTSDPPYDVDIALIVAVIIIIIHYLFFIIVLSSSLMFATLQKLHLKVLSITQKI